jgi:hypothetical protein
MVALWCYLIFAAWRIADTWPNDMGCTRRKGTVCSSRLNCLGFESEAFSHTYTMLKGDSFQPREPLPSAFFAVQRSLSVCCLRNMF